MNVPVVVDRGAGPRPQFDRDKVDAALARTKAIFAPPAGGSRRIVVFGTGELGRAIAACARAAGLEVCAAADNDERRWDSELDGVPILSPAAAVERYADSAVFVIGIFNPRAVRAQLVAAGCTRIANYPEFFWNFAPSYTAMSGLATPDVVLAHAGDIEASFDLLHDEASRREYAAQVAWRLTLDDTVLEAPLPLANMYFDRSVYAISDRETFVDCGGFDGDSLRFFLKRVDGKFAHAFVLEPDPANREKLAACVAGLAPGARAAVTVLPYAVSDRNGTTHFEPGLGAGSNASDSGAIQVPCRRLDDVVEGAPSIIKIDVEGAEAPALHGAARLIGTYRPVLAVVAYHHCADLWELPLIINALMPGARLFFRRHADHCWETIFYAVPAERCIA